MLKSVRYCFYLMKGLFMITLLQNVCYKLEWLPFSMAEDVVGTQMETSAIVLLLGVFKEERAFSRHTCH